MKKTNLERFTLKQLLEEGRINCVEDSHCDYMGGYPFTPITTQIEKDGDAIAFYVMEDIEKKHPLELKVDEHTRNHAIYTKVPVSRIECDAEIVLNRAKDLIICVGNGYRFWNVQREDTQKFLFGEDTPIFKHPKFERCVVETRWKKGTGYYAKSFIDYKLGGE